MSIGETDKTWWKKIVEELLRDHEKGLFIYEYGNGYEKNKEYEASEIKKRFLKKADLSEDFYRSKECDDLFDRIRVIGNTDLFNFEYLKEIVKKRSGGDITVPERLQNRLI